jgi:ABC-2 type transport system ATP-binding protein
MTPAVVCTGLRHSFGDKVAVDDIDLTIPAGTVFGLLGPNGAGKPTP